MLCIACHTYCIYNYVCRKEIERKSYQKHKEIADSRNQEIALEKEVQELRKEKVRLMMSIRTTY